MHLQIGFENTVKPSRPVKNINENVGMQMLSADFFTVTVAK